MTDDQSFIAEIYRELKSSVEVEDWKSIKELLSEISDYLQETGDFNDDDDDDFDDD